MGKPNGQREAGNVKWFSNEKGYGFIQREGLEDVFVHHTEIAMDGFRTLDAGEPVEFEIMRGERGPKARNVHRLEAGDGYARANGGTNGAGRASTGSNSVNGSGGLVKKLFGRFLN